MAKLTVKLDDPKTGKGVRFQEFTPAMLHMLVRAERFAIGVSEVDEIIVTSANDSKHGAGSRHYTNEALDFRTHNWPNQESRRWFRRELERVFGPQFRCLLEYEGTPNAHVHAQVRKGHIYTREDF
jgi:hypothetical protein